MRRLSSPKKQSISIPQKLRRLIVSPPLLSHHIEVPRRGSLFDGYAAIPLSTLEERRQVRHYDAELVQSAHKTTKALLPRNISDPKLYKGLPIPQLGELRLEQPHTITLRGHQEISVFSRIFATVINNVRRDLTQTGFLRICEEVSSALSPAEAQALLFAQQRLSRYRILELEYQNHARELHEHLSTILISYTNESETRHHQLMQLVATSSIENFFSSLSTRALYKSIQHPHDESPVVFFQCTLTGPTQNIEPVEVEACHDYKDLVSISELAYAIASEQSAQAMSLFISQSTDCLSSQTHTGPFIRENFIDEYEYATNYYVESATEISKPQELPDTTVTLPSQYQQSTSAHDEISTDTKSLRSVLLRHTRVLDEDRPSYASDLLPYKNETARANNPIFTGIDVIVGRPIDSPPLRPRTMSRLRPSRTSFPQTCTISQSKTDAKVCSVPLTMITFQEGFLNADSSTNSKKSTNSPYSKQCPSNPEALPQSLTHKHFLNIQSRGNKSPRRATSVNGNQLRNLVSEHAPQSGMQLRDRFGSPLWSLTNHQFKQEVSRIVNYQDILFSYTSHFRVLCADPRPLAYEFDFRYTAWLLSLPIKLTETISSIVSPWPSPKNRARILNIKALPQELATNLRRNLVWLDAVYVDSFQDIKDLCFSILWILDQGVPPSWYIPNTKAMRLRRAKMNRQLLLKLGLLDPYDERTITPTIFSRLTSPVRNTTSGGNGCTDTTEESSNSLSVNETDNVERTYSTILTKRYKTEVPAVARFHFNRHRIVYGGSLTLSIPFIYEDIDFILSELKLNSVRHFVSYGLEIERIMRHRINESSEPGLTWGYSRASNRDPVMFKCDSHTNAASVSTRPPELQYYLVNGGVTPDVSPCLSEFSSFLICISDTESEDEPTDSSSTCSSNSQISLLYANSDIAIGCHRPQHGKRLANSVSETKVARFSDMRDGCNTIDSVSQPFDDYNNLFLMGLNQRLSVLHESQKPPSSSTYNPIKIQSPSQYLNKFDNSHEDTTLKILEHSLDFNAEALLCHSPVPLVHSSKTNYVALSTHMHGCEAEYNSRDFHIIDSCYPYRKILRKVCFVGLQFLADLSYLQECEERRAEFYTKYSLTPDMYAADSTIKEYYDEPLLPCYYKTDSMMSIGIRVVPKVATSTELQMRPVVLLDNLSSTTVGRLSQKSKHVLHQNPLYLPSLRTILHEMTMGEAPWLSEGDHELDTTPHMYEQTVEEAELPSEPEPAHTPTINSPGLHLNSDMEHNAVSRYGFAPSKFHLNDCDLIGLFSMRTTDIKELLDSLLQWVKSMYTVFALDGRALLSSICGASYWAVVTSSSLELKKILTKEAFVTLYKRYVYSRDTKNIPEIVGVMKDIDEVELIDKFKLFEQKRGNAIRFLKLANLLYAEHAAEAIQHIVYQVVIPMIATILSTIIKETMATIELAQTSAQRYLHYLRKCEPKYTVDIGVITEYFQIINHCEELTRKIFWLFRNVKSVDNNLVTISTNPSKILIPSIPSLRSAWNLCTLMFSRARKTLASGIQRLIQIQSPPFLSENMYDCDSKRDKGASASELAEIDHIRAHLYSNPTTEKARCWPFSKYDQYHLLAIRVASSNCITDNSASFIRTSDDFIAELKENYRL